MRQRWTQRSAWIIWISASLLGWVLIFSLFTAFPTGEPEIARDAETGANGALTPASGPRSDTPAK